MVKVKVMHNSEGTWVGSFSCTALPGSVMKSLIKQAPRGMASPFPLLTTSHQNPSVLRDDLFYDFSSCLKIYPALTTSYWVCFGLSFEDLTGVNQGRGNTVPSAQTGVVSDGQRPYLLFRGGAQAPGNAGAVLGWKRWHLGLA